MKCAKCGKKFDGEFCPECGTAIKVYSEMMEQKPTNRFTQFLQQLTPKRFAKIVLLLSMVCFVFPFLTVSCQGNEVQTMTGVELMSGFDFGTEHVEGNELIICAFAFAFLGIVHAFLRKTHTLTAICGLISSMLLVLYRYTLTRNILEQGYDPSTIKIKYHFAWYAAVALGILAAIAPIIFKHLTQKQTVEKSDSTEKEPIVEQATMPPDDAQQMSIETPQKGKKKRFVFVGLIVAAVLVAAIASMGNHSNTSSANASIQTVQNGYLGEFTDMTVQELFNSYYQDALSCKAEWDSGENDDGEQIVQVKYLNEDIGDTTVQFTMLDDQVFKVSAFVDPIMTIEKTSDLPAWLNNLYFMTYIMRHETDVGDVEKEKAFVERMDQIAGSAVLYGAAANYDGDRSALCTLFEEDEMDVTVPWLLDSYGYFDMGYYTSADAVQETPTDDASDDYIFPSDRQYITDADMVDWDKATASLARNEIYARHGYVFQTQDIQNYFAAKSWYFPDATYDGSGLSDVEKANIDTIAAYEQKQGWRNSTVSPEALAQQAVTDYISGQGSYCAGIDYVEPYAEGQYLVCAKEGEYEFEMLYVVEITDASASVIGYLDGGVFVPF